MLIEKDEARFWSKVALSDGNGCMLWMAGQTSAGYGSFGLSGVTRLAHRISYELAYGEIPTGLVLDHLCRVPLCVNPRHLEAVTQAENIRRGDMARARSAHHAAKTHCLRGHPYDEANTYVTPSGMRNCRACRRAQSSAHYHRHKKASC